ncbi:MAG: helix-turn-helix domain-containing protein, partial [Pseudomonas sp.]
PPLRERVQDILPLFEALLTRHGGARPAAQQLQALMPLLLRHTWPGNIRELDNIAERAALCAQALEGADGIGLATLFPEFFENEQANAQPLPVGENLRSLGKAAEAAHARRMLDSCDGNLDKAARCLGISRSTLWRRLRTRS